MKPSHIVVGLACIFGAALPARAQAQRAIAPPQGAPGTVTLTLDQRDLSVWNESRNRWVSPRGRYRLMVGSSSRDIRLTGIVTPKP